MRCLRFVLRTTSLATLVMVVTLQSAQAQAVPIKRAFDRVSVGLFAGAAGLNAGTSKSDTPGEPYNPAAPDVAINLDIPFRPTGSFRAEIGRATWNIAYQEPGPLREQSIAQWRGLFTYVHAPWRSRQPVVAYVGGGAGIYIYDSPDGPIGVRRRHGPHMQLGAMIAPARSRVSFDGGVRLQFMLSPNAGVGDANYQRVPNGPIKSVILIIPSAFLGARVHF
jgi:hypothetical protein